MALHSVFNIGYAQGLIIRVNRLTPTTAPLWGKMDVAQMLAHCNVTYELAYDNIHPKPNFLMRFILKNFVKKAVVSEKPYPKNSRTAPVFMVHSNKDFEKERVRLIAYIEKTRDLGEKYFEGKENHGFGKLTSTEWSNLFYKHLNHHLTQFGV